MLRHLQEPSLAMEGYDCASLLADTSCFLITGQTK